MKKEFALKLIKKTITDYNRIAIHFGSTRVYPWQEMKEFTNYIKDGDKVLDLGCGNGRLFKILKDKNTDYIGIDSSEKLIELAKKNFPEQKDKFQVGDILNLSFDNNAFNMIFSIAALHHIPGEELRLESLKETKRVLKKDRLLMITVWNLWEQKKYLPYIKTKNNYSSTEVEKHNNLNIEDKSFSRQARDKLSSNYKYFDIGDSLIPWKDSEGKITVERYYHAFKLDELENLIKKTGFEIIKSQKTDYNLYIIAKK